MAKVGDVIKTYDGMHVVTETQDESITETQLIDKYISRNAVVKVDDEWITIDEIVQQRIRMYLASHRIIDKTL